MQQYIDNHLFQTLERLTLNCGGNIACNTYIRFFQNKSNMSDQDFQNFKNDIRQELLARHTNNQNISQQQQKCRNQIRQLLHI